MCIRDRTWTANPENTTDTGGNLVGFYTKIGNFVYVSIYIQGVALSSSTGVAACLGLPFVAKSGDDPPVFVSTGSIGYSNGTISGEGRTAYFWDNQSRFTCFQAASDNASNWVDIGSTELIFSGHYLSA